MPELIGIVTTQEKTKNIKELLINMCQAIKHEQWYKTDIFIDKTVGLGRVHLGIFNPEPQPIFNENRSLCVIMEGEIYDCQNIKEELISRGHKFSVENDPEFILHLYEEYGMDSVYKLNGSFVLAIWDQKSHELILINDRYGLRPLYYTEQNGYLLFGSEVKAILQDKSFNKIVDDRSVVDFFSFGYILGNKTFFQEIELIPPASIMTYRAGQINIKQYWDYDLNEESEKKPEEFYINKFAKLVSEAVECKQKGQHKIGIPLSGGFDSRIIMASINKQHYPIHTFTFGKPNCDDARFAQMIANKLGTIHHFFEFKPDDLVSYAQEAVYLTDGMLNCIHAHRLQTYGEMKEHMDVALSGFELLFSSYDISQIPYIIENSKKNSDEEILLEYFNRSDFLKDNNSAVGIEEILLDCFTYSDFFKDENNSIGILESLFSESYFSIIKNYPLESIKKILIEEPNNVSPFKKIGYYNIKQRQRRFFLYGTILMRSKMEVRTPLTDYKLMDFTMTLPPELRAKGKIIIKKTITDFYPELVSIPCQTDGMPINASGLQLEIHNKISVIKRKINRILKKTIFQNTKDFADYDTWMRDNEHLRNYILNILLDNRTKNRLYFNQEYINKILDLHMSGETDYSELIGRLLTFELWNRQFID